MEETAKKRSENEGDHRESRRINIATPITLVLKKKKRGKKIYVEFEFHSFYYVCIAVLTLDAGLLARSQYPEGPATVHLDTGFS